MAANRYKTNNGCIKHLPQTGYTEVKKRQGGISLHKHFNTVIKKVEVINMVSQ